MTERQLRKISTRKKIRNRRIILIKKIADYCKRIYQKIYGILDLLKEAREKYQKWRIKRVIKELGLSRAMKQSEQKEPFGKSVIITNKARYKCEWLDGDYMLDEYFVVTREKDGAEIFRGTRKSFNWRGYLGDEMKMAQSKMEGEGIIAIIKLEKPGFKF